MGMSYEELEQALLRQGRESVRLKQELEHERYNVEKTAQEGARRIKDLQRDHERLRNLVQYCRMRLKQDAYGEHVDKCLADLSLLDPDPEMQGKLVQSQARGYYDCIDCRDGETACACGGPEHE